MQFNFSWRGLLGKRSLPLKRVLTLIGRMIIPFLLGVILTVPIWSQSRPLLAQIPGLTSSQATQPPPVGVDRSGLLEATYIRFEGKELFRIASPAVFNRSNPDSQIPVEVRARQIEANLNQLIAPTSIRAVRGEKSYATVLDPESLKVVIETINGQPVLFATDAYLAEPQVLLTVTTADAQYNFVPAPELAKQWQAILEVNLTEALQLRQPQAFRQHLRRALILLAALVVLTLLLLAVWRDLGQRIKRLETRQTEQRQAPLSLNGPATGNDSPASYGFDLPGLLRQQLNVERKLQVFTFLHWLLFWLIIFLWLSGIAATLYNFPQTRRYATNLATIPSILLAAWFIAGLINRLTNIAVDRFVKAYESTDFLRSEDVERRSLRLTTIMSAIKGLKTLLIYAIAVLIILQLLRISPISVLALGAVLALAVSLATQNVVKDLVNGFLILLEDQYGIGDMVAIGSVSGMVESMNLRVTQLRTDDGRLVTIPNGTITQVENFTRYWSRLDYTVQVAYDTDVDFALSIMQQVAVQLSQDPVWQASILNPVEILGVEALSHTGLTIRIWIRTIPLQRGPVAREFRRRLKKAFDQAGIAIGVPQQYVVEDLVEKKADDGQEN